MTRQTSALRVAFVLARCSTVLKLIRQATQSSAQRIAESTNTNAICSLHPHSSSVTTECQILVRLLRSIVAAKPSDRDPKFSPIAEELPKSSPEEDRNDNVPVEVHCQQHDYVCHSEGSHVNHRPDELLDRRWSECDICLRWIRWWSVCLWAATVLRSRDRQPNVVVLQLSDPLMKR